MSQQLPVSRQTGFTLIELSIVLVIIGLLIGGVMVGRDMIKAAALRSTISQVEQYKTAIMTFRTKYNCIPGDCPTAESQGLGTGAEPGANGNGNQAIDWSFQMIANPVFMKEVLNFFYHLGQANLVSGSFLGNQGFGGEGTGAFLPYAPTAKINPDAVITAITTQGQNYLLLHNSGLYYGMNVMKATQAKLIDTKLDDGMPLTGSVRAIGAYSHPVISENVHSIDPFGCAFYPENNSSLPAEYDVSGVFDSYVGQAFSDPLNPDRLECGLAFGKAW